MLTSTNAIFGVERAQNAVHEMGRNPSGRFILDAALRSCVTRNESF
jgi:hypothetical protein